VFVVVVNVIIMCYILPPTKIIQHSDSVEFMLPRCNYTYAESITLIMLRKGGSFGGKDTQAAMIALPVIVAANR